MALLLIAVGAALEHNTKVRGRIPVTEEIIANEMLEIDALRSSGPPLKRS